MTRVGAVWTFEKRCFTETEGIGPAENALRIVSLSFGLVDEGLGKAGDYPFRDGGFLGGKGAAHVSPRNFRIRLIFISPKQYNCRPLGP